MKRKNDTFRFPHTLIQVILLIAIYANLAFTLPSTYLFDWFRHQETLYFIFSGMVILTSLFVSFKLGYVLVGGHVLGLFLGYFLGDFLLEKNLSKITESMGAGEVYRLSYHYGVFIWLSTIILSLLLFFLVTFIMKTRRRNTDY